jgi:hypothetical protein
VYPLARLPAAALALAVFLAVGPAQALDEIATEQDIADLLATPAHGAQETLAGRRWAVLPEFGYGPDTGPLVGAKFTHRDVADTGATLDLEGQIALEGQKSLDVSLGSPHLGGDRFLAVLQASFGLDPQREFFGLGNNSLGHQPDPLSTHEWQRTQVSGTLGWRPVRSLALDVSVGVRYVSILRGTRDGDIPFTVDRFPTLPGVHGGYVNPLGLSLVWTTREAVVRPTHGWRVILRLTHANRALGSDFQFTRYVVDVGYLFPLFDGAHVLAVRANGGFIMGPRRDIPFWELESLGGDDTLPGFFPGRFLGTSRVLVNGEYRARLAEFDVRRWWHVQLDGVAFGGAGQVFISNDELRDEFQLSHDLVSRIGHDFRYAYGGGLRIALSEALVARIDAGFSTEETGLVYLEFGQTF